MEDKSVVMSLVQIILTVSPVILTALIIPRRLLLRRNLARIMEGKYRVRWWDDAASSLPIALMVTLSAIVMQLIVCLWAQDSEMVTDWISTFLRFMTLIALMVFISGIVEGCRLRFQRNADLISGIICGIWWLLPPVIFGAYVIKVGEPKLYMLGLSPVAALLAGHINVKPEFGSQIHIVLIIALAVTVLAAAGAQLFRHRAKQLFQTSLPS